MPSQVRTTTTTTTPRVKSKRPALPPIDVNELEPISVDDLTPVLDARQGIEARRLNPPAAQFGDPNPRRVARIAGPAFTGVWNTVKGVPSGIITQAKRAGDFDIVGAAMDLTDTVLGVKRDLSNVGTPMHAYNQGRPPTPEENEAAIQSGSQLSTTLALPKLVESVRLPKARTASIPPEITDHTPKVNLAKPRPSTYTVPKEPILGEPTTVPPSQLRKASGYVAQEVISKVPLPGAARLGEVVKNRINRSTTTPAPVLGYRPRPRTSTVPTIAPVYGDARVQPIRPRVVGQEFDPVNPTVTSGSGPVDLSPPRVGDDAAFGQSPESTVTPPRKATREFYDPGNPPAMPDSVRLPKDVPNIPPELQTEQTYFGPKRKGRATAKPSTSTGTGTVTGAAVEPTPVPTPVRLPAKTESSTIATQHAADIAKRDAIINDAADQAVQNRDANVQLKEIAAQRLPKGKTGTTTSSPSPSPKKSVQWKDSTGAIFNGTVRSSFTNASGQLMHSVVDSTGTRRLVHNDNLTGQYPGSRPGTKPYNNGRDRTEFTIDGKDENADLVMNTSLADLLPERFKNARSITGASALGGVINPDRPNLRGLYGEDLREPDDTGAVQSFDRHSSPSAGSKSPFNTVLTDRSGSNDPFVVLHEVSHAIGLKDLTEDEWKRFANLYHSYSTKARSVDKKYEGGDMKQWEQGRAALNDLMKTFPMAMVTDYQTQNRPSMADIDEAFASLQASYILNPTRFKAKYPQIYGMFKQFNDGREYVRVERH